MRGYPRQRGRTKEQSAQNQPPAVACSLWYFRESFVQAVAYFSRSNRPLLSLKAALWMKLAWTDAPRENRVETVTCALV